MKVLVAGAGISGLAAAFFLKRQGHDTIVVDPDPRPGGVLRSDRVEGFLCEGGAQSILAGEPDTAALIEALGLQDQVVWPLPQAKRRFIYWNGQLRAVPYGPLSLLTTSLLTFAGKRRLIQERRVPAAIVPDESDHEETVFDFGARRLGLEAAERLVAPATVGIFAGDARTLELRSAFPKMAALERDHGGLFAGMRAQKKNGQAIGQSFSFRDGVETLPRALAQRVPITNDRVISIAQRAPGFDVQLESQTLHVDGVVVATPAATTARLLGELVPAARYLATMQIAPAVVIHLGFTREIPRLAAFGFLVARGQGVDLLGAQFETATFPDRGPKGAALIRCIRGGMFEVDAITADDGTLIERTLRDLRTIMGLKARPDFTRVWRVPSALPQYRVGHDKHIRAIEAEVAAIKGLGVLGNGLRGAAVRDCIRNAATLARNFAP